MRRDVCSELGLVEEDAPLESPDDEKQHVELKKSVICLGYWLMVVSLRINIFDSETAIHLLPSTISRSPLLNIRFIWALSPNTQLLKKILLLTIRSRHLSYIQFFDFEISPQQKWRENHHTQFHSVMLIHVCSQQSHVCCFCRCP